MSPKRVISLGLSIFGLLAITSSAQEQKTKTMTAWQINSYGLNQLQLSKKATLPAITRPDQFLVKVEASSINPLDVLMLDGLGSRALNFMRTLKSKAEFPLIVGRDFSGTIVSKGSSVRNNLKVGTKVWGVVPVQDQGCHAEYVVVDAKTIGKAPKNVTAVEAASFLYTGLTAWSGLVISAGLNLNNVKGVKALVMGASGGVGSAAVQMLKAGGAFVVCTCSTSAIPLVQSFNPDHILDYKSADFDERLAAFKEFDLIMDCAGLGTDFARTAKIKFKRYFTFTSPFLKNIDDMGLIFGILSSSISDILHPNLSSLRNGGLVVLGFFIPSAEGIKYIHRLVSTKKMISAVEKVYPFEDMPSAYKRVQDGHLRGKIVVDFGDLH